MASVHEPIKNNQVRLVKFGHDGDRTRATFQTFPLEGPIPPYLALSYTWVCNGSGTARNHTIDVCQHQLPVLDSLQQFFHALKLKGSVFDETWWWIDSICIDLTNVDERVHQVLLMGQIYDNAQEVVSWLGEGSDNTGQAIDFIEVLNKVVRQEKYGREELRREFQQDHYHSHWAALLDFFQQRWWSRIWTVQEYTLPARLSFWCGTRSISRSAVEAALTAGDRCSALAFKSTPAFRYGWNRRRLVQRLHDRGRLTPEARKLSSISVAALAAYSSCFEASDDRDRLYGLRGLATDGSILYVDYSLSVDEVYLSFAKSFIEHYKSLDIICFASIYHKADTPGSLLPSWVPDWRTKVDPLVVPLMVSQSARTHIGNLRPNWAISESNESSTCFAASKESPAIYEFAGSKLFARGIVLDNIDGLARSRSTELVQSTSLLNSPQVPATSTDQVACSSSEILTSVCKSLVWDRKDRYLQKAMPASEFLGDFIWLCAQLVQSDSTTTLVLKEFQEWFDWTKALQIHGQNFESILQDSREASAIMESLPASGAPNQDEMDKETFINRFFDTVVRLSLRLMVTSNGNIGLAPIKAMKGDLVCVLFGCSVPVVLRRHSDLEDSWTFVGECFVDGYMEGQCLSQADLEERVFCIE